MDRPVTVATTASVLTFYPGSALAVQGIPFVFADFADLTVEHLPSGGGAPVLMARDVNYTLAGSGLAGSGTITPLATWGADERWRVRRMTATTQPRKYFPHTPFPAQATELALDRLTMVDQDQARDIDDLAARAVRLPEGEAEYVLPSALLRKGLFWAFDAATGLPALTAGTGAVQAASQVLLSSGPSVQGAFDNYVGISAQLTAGSDQSTLLQAILSNSAYANKRRVQIDEGTFDIKDVSVPSGTWLRGKSMEKTIVRRAGTISQGLLAFAAGATDIVISDMTIDGLSAADAASLIWMGAHGGNIRIERVRFKGGMGRWALRGDPAAYFEGLSITDCEFVDCSYGGIIILAANAGVQGSRGIRYNNNKFLRCGGNMLSLRPFGAYFQFDFWFDVQCNGNSILDCTNTGANGPIPVEMWGCTGFQQIGNYLNSGTRGLSGGEGQKNGIIAHNIICNQTLYAMEGGNNADNVHVHDNVAINCATFYRDTGAAATITRRVVIEDNLIVGSGLTAYNAGAPSDVIALGNDNATYLTDCVIRNNTFRDPKWARSVMRIRPDAANSNEVLVEGNRYLSSNYEDPVSFVNPQECNLISRNNFMRRTAAFDNAHPAGSAQICYSYGGRTSASGASVVSENDTVEMAAAITSGTFYAIGRNEGATARYGARISGFKPIGNFSAGPFIFADSTGTTILEGFDLRGLATQTGLLNNINTSLALGLVDGTTLIGSAAYVKAAARVGTRRKVLRYEGTVATRTVKIRCDTAAGAQASATFQIAFVCANNNAAPSVNNVIVGFSSATAPASAPTMFQDNGTAATLASALNGSNMEATITLPASNGTWVATITADAAGTVGNGLNDYSVRIA